jgi:isopentenyl-diphosphate delta-isomerase
MALRTAGGKDDRLSSEERVVLVDRNDRELGTEEKLRAHLLGVLHRAVSVFVFDRHDRLLLQRRATRKYHSAGKWSNTCCSHPRPGEAPLEAARRRLSEEMGFACDLRPAFSFTYRAELDRGLVEHELDHVFVGRFTGTPQPDASEVSGWGWMPLPALIADCAVDRDKYSAWLPTALEEMIRRGMPSRDLLVESGTTASY